MVLRSCNIGISYGAPSLAYSFPNGHPMNSSRLKLFTASLQSMSKDDSLTIINPVAATENDLLRFHTREYVELVKSSSKKGSGFLDYGDTPSFPGVFEASLYPVGSTIAGLKTLNEKRFDHFFNPVGGLHHARRDRAGGFCVFNDPAIGIEMALNDFQFNRVAYVDIDCHHGDGVFYGFENDPRVVIADVHEDGKFLYPGTGSASEAGRGLAKGTKLNIPLAPYSGDAEFVKAIDRVTAFLKLFDFDFIFFQCGADGLAGDPITHLQYSRKAHAYATEQLHRLAHARCGGRILAMGGGGYNPQNVAEAWTAVARGLCASV